MDGYEYQAMIDYIGRMIHYKQYDRILVQASIDTDVSRSDFDLLKFIADELKEKDFHENNG